MLLIDEGITFITTFHNVNILTCMFYGPFKLCHKDWMFRLNAHEVVITSWGSWIFGKLRVPELGACQENTAELMDAASEVDGKFVELECLLVLEADFS